MAIDEHFGGAYLDGGHRARHRILGHRLPAFTPWHLLLLQSVDSPLLRKGAVGLDDVRRLIGICRLSFPDSRIRLARVSLWQGWQLRRHGMKSVIESLLAYLSDFFTRPQFTIHARDTGGKATPQRGAAPELFRLVWDVQGWIHCPERVVWNMPLAHAYVQQAGALRARGEDIDFNILSEKERRFQEEMKKRGIQPGQPIPKPPKGDKPPAGQA